MRCLTTWWSSGSRRPRRSANSWGRPRRSAASAVMTTSGSASLPWRWRRGAPSFASRSVHSTRAGKVVAGQSSTSPSTQYAEPSPPSTASGPWTNRGSAGGGGVVGVGVWAAAGFFAGAFFAAVGRRDADEGRGHSGRAAGTGVWAGTGLGAGPGSEGGATAGVVVRPRDRDMRPARQEATCCPESPGWGSVRPGPPGAGCRRPASVAAARSGPTPSW